MSKELTEQWRNETLEEDFYYVKNKDCLGVEIDYYNVLHSGIKYWSGCEDEDVEEVLAPVSTYDQFSQLVKKVEQLEEQLESERMAKNEGVELVAELERRLKEAESVIRLYLREEPPLSSPPWKKYFHAVAKQYLEKYGVEK